MFPGRWLNSSYVFRSSFTLAHPNEETNHGVCMCVCVRMYVYVCVRVCVVKGTAIRANVFHAPLSDGSIGDQKDVRHSRLPPWNIKHYVQMKWKIPYTLYKNYVIRITFPFLIWHLKWFLSSASSSNNGIKIGLWCIVTTLARLPALK